MKQPSFLTILSLARNERDRVKPYLAIAQVSLKWCETKQNLICCCCCPNHAIFNDQNTVLDRMSEELNLYELDGATQSNR